MRVELPDIYKLIVYESDSTLVVLSVSLSLLCPYSAEVKKERSYRCTSTPRICFRDVDRENFTFLSLFMAWNELKLVLTVFRIVSKETGNHIRFYIK